MNNTPSPSFIKELNSLLTKIDETIKNENKTETILIFERKFICIRTKYIIPKINGVIKK
jgi:hypothetical protein